MPCRLSPYQTLIVAEILADKIWLTSYGAFQVGTCSKSYVVLSQVHSPAPQEGCNSALRMDASGVQAVALDAHPS